MIIPKVKNLIKDDFSDFRAYQGAIVTRNKTFPIDVFKGGRNLSIGLTRFVSTPNATPTRLEGFKELMMNPDGLNYGEVRFEFGGNSSPTSLISGENYTLSFDMKSNRKFQAKGALGAYSPVKDFDVTEEWNRFEITYKVDEGVTKPTFRLYMQGANSVDDWANIKNIKIEKGGAATEYSPAPEDGYGLDLPNGAYHIQTSGGTSAIKYFKNITPYGAGIKYNVEVVVKAFSKLMVAENGAFTKTYQENDSSIYTASEVSNGVRNVGLQFRSVNDVGEPLDFIASDPFIIDEQSINTKNVIDIVQLPEISREEKQLTILSTDKVIIDDFISFKMSTKGSIYQRNMKHCDVVLVGKHELTSEWINIKRFIASDLVDSGNLQEIDYGDFGVLKSEYDDTTQRTKLTCYDRMLQAQIPYDSEVMDLTYPMTISQVLNRLAIVCKLDLVVNTVNNLEQVIHSDLWANQSFTYADVLDHIAQATTSIIAIRNNKLEIFNPIDNDFTIQGKFNSLKMGETFGKTNIVNVSQEPQHYNKFAPSNALEIPLEERKELAFSNNPILNQDMQTWADRLYLQVKDLEYSTFESSTIGYGIFEVGDMVDVYEANEDVIHRVMITNETFDFKHALTTEIGSNLPLVHKNQYVVETDQVRQGQTTYLIVDQLNGVIEALVQKVDDEADKTAQLRIDVDSITSTVSNISNGNLLTNGSGELGFLGWSGGSVAKYVKEILEARTTDLRYLENLRYNIGFVPMYNRMSLSEWNISFYNNGFDVSPIAFIVPDIEHSYRAKVSKFKPFNIDVLEFNDFNKANALTADKVTNFAFNNAMDYVQFTFTPSASTQYVRFKYNRTGISPTDRLNIAEVMFNRGLPKSWQVSPLNAVVYSQSTRVQLSDRITDEVTRIDGDMNRTNAKVDLFEDTINLNTTRIDGVSGDIHNAGLDISALNGVRVYGKKFEILNQAKNKTLFSVDTVSGQEAIKMVGDIQTIDGVIKLDSATRTIHVGGSRLMNPADRDSLEISTKELFIGNLSTGGLPSTLTMLFKRADGANVFGTPITLGQGGLALIGDILTVSGSTTLSGTTLIDGNINVRGVASINTLTTIAPSKQMDVNAVLMPGKNNGYSLGLSARRWSEIFLGMQPNVSSDIRYKSDIQDIDPLLIEIIGREVKPKQYRTIYDDKIHFGYIAQDVERALYKYCGNDKDKYAVLHKDESYMSLLYGELNVIIEAYNRQEIEKLKEELLWKEP